MNGIPCLNKTYVCMYVCMYVVIDQFQRPDKDCYWFNKQFTLVIDQFQRPDKDVIDLANSSHQLLISFTNQTKIVVFFTTEYMQNGTKTTLGPYDLVFVQFAPVFSCVVAILE